jgi:subfamily B ATP-binding cassette protein MsbA
MNPRPEITNLVELEERREQIRKKLRIWHLLLPISGDDVQAYRSLLKYVKPYRGKILLSIVFSMTSALFLGTEVALLQGALAKIVGGTTIADQIAASSDAQSTPGFWTQARDTIDEAAHRAAEPPSVSKRVHDWVVEKRKNLENQVYKWAGIPPPPAAVQELSRPAKLVFNDPAEKDRRKILLWVLSGLLVVAVLLGSIAKYGQEVIVTGASRRVVRDVRAGVFRHLMDLSVRFHQRNHSAQLVSRITGDLEVFGRFLTDSLVKFVQDFFEFASMILFVAVNHGSFIFVIAAVIAVAIVPINEISRRLRKGDKRSQAGMAEVQTVVQEALVGQRVVKAFASERREYERFRAATRDHMKSQMRVRKLRSMTEPIVLTVGALGLAAIVLWGGHRVLEGESNGTALMVNCLALVRAMTNLRGMSKQMNDFQVGLAAADRVGTLLEARSEIREKEGAVALPRFSQEIRFAGVHFHHEHDKPTLRGVDLVIRKGEKVALVGPSGAGKTTFVDLVPRFYDVDAGAITIDGHDLRDVTLHSLREQIGIVSQETILFRFSIRDNIAYGRPGATDDEIVAAATAAHAHEFVLRKPDGYATRIGERGLHLSGGERQRIAIARALLLDPPILILDEATSALDSESESIVQTALQRLMEGRTVIAIAHRLATIRDYDRIVVLDKGRVVEIGSHDELMSRPDGLYRRHYEKQTRRDAADESSEPVAPS